METMHAAGRRRLPPVPRPAAAARTVGRPAVVEPRSGRPDDADDVTEVIDTGRIAAEHVRADVAGADRDGSEAVDEQVGAVAGEPGDAGRADTEQIDALGAGAVPAVADADDDDDDDATDEPVGADDVDGEPGDAGRADTEQIDALGPDTVPGGAEDPTTEHPATVTPTTVTPTTVTPATVAPTTTAPDRGAVAAEVPPAAPVGAPAAAPLVPAPRSAPPAGPVERTHIEEPAGQDPAQHFVARLRASATDFADAAGAESAVVREAVPPARHRRARCRLVLRYQDGSVSDVTLLGPAGSPGQPSRHGFDRQILRWLGTGLLHDDAWLVADDDVPGGLAVDLTAWLSAS